MPSSVAGEERGAVAVFTDLDPPPGQPLAEVARSGATEVTGIVAFSRPEEIARLDTFGAAGGMELPSGGWRRPGYGREKGFAGLLGSTQTTTAVVGA